MQFLPAVYVPCHVCRGQVVVQGKPEQVAANPDSHTGVYLKRML